MSGPTKFMIRRAQKSGKRYNVKPSDILDLIFHESNFTPNAHSGAGAQGLTQFMPQTAGAYGVEYGTSKHAQKTQIRGAAKLLHSSGYKAGNEAAIRSALAKYYSGSGSVASPYADALLSEHQYEKYDKGALVGAAKGKAKGGTTTTPTLKTKNTKTKLMTAPAQSMASERVAATLSYLQDEDVTTADTVNYVTSLKSLQDQPAQFANVKGKKLVAGKTKTATADTAQAVGGAVKGGKKLKGSSEHQVVQIGKMAQRMGLNVGENPHFGGVAPVHVTGSYHYQGRAIDVSGSVDLMRKFAKKVHKLYGPKLAELFWNGPGATNVDNGQDVQKGYVSDHTDHVHVAV